MNTYLINVAGIKNILLKLLILTSPKPSASPSPSPSPIHQGKEEFGLWAVTKIIEATLILHYKFLGLSL